jgi:CCR4-NOT transcription complex subunit 7/8
MWAEDSISLLTRAGLHFDSHATDGIDPVYFAELLMTSGLVLNDDVRSRPLLLS